MLIFAIDDEPKMLRLLHGAIAEAAPGAEIMDFRLGSDAVTRIQEGGLSPDVVFADIQMPGMTGLELAVRLKQLAPETGIVFVTGYDEYAIDAYRLHVGGYIMKPVEASRIREELDHLGSFPPTDTKKLKVRCFGNFEVLWQDTPLEFSRQKTKELFAYLIDRGGAYCTAGEIIGVLWESSAAVKDANQYLRVLTGDLTSALNKIGQKEVLLRKRGQWAVQRNLIDCDYYRMLEGDMNAVNTFRGQYMAQYSWAKLSDLRWREERDPGKPFQSL